MSGNNIRVTVLIENTSEGSLACEHGLSLFIEYMGKRILLDSGSSEAFGENAEKLGISLTGLDAYVLSHGHYDHSGGFDLIFRNDPTARVYAQKEALDTYLSGSGGLHEISVPKNIAEQDERFILTEGIREILPRIYVIPHNTPGLEKIGEKSRLHKKHREEILPDDFAHEQSLVIDSKKGLVVFNSCSHAGAANIIKEAKAAFGQKPIYAYVGGLHMKGKKDGKEICAFSEDEINCLCSAFINEGVKKIYTGHCTGVLGFEKLKSRLGERIQKLTTGLIFDL
ncbi:MAG: MBL fold metallo-hydrolase [Eubacterium sp.]|nr:MBL fold metallo-hydrolase [Eubacterium sp.]